MQSAMTDDSLPFEPCFTLRPIHLGDSALLLAGRNSAQVHPFLFSDHSITSEEHASWMKKRLSAPQMPAYLFLNEEKPLGLVHLSHLDTEHKRGEWSFYLWADAPKGAGTIMLSAFLDALFVHYDVRKLCALVLYSNVKSLHLHRKLGFKEEGLLKEQVVKHGVAHDVVAFGLFNRNWQVSRHHFAGAIANVVIQPS